MALVSRYVHLCALLAIGFANFGSGVSTSTAQSLPFASSDDPSERVRPRLWQEESSVDALAGFSLIGAQWRSAISLSSNFSVGSFAARLQSSFRTGIYGTYGADFDEWYDALRTVSFIRFQPTPSSDPSRVYFRAGPLNRIRLGTGHLVNFYNSTAAWDERTLGSEFMWRNRTFDLAGFTDNILLDGVVGGRFTLRPLSWAREPRTRSFEIGVSYATDLENDLAGEPVISTYGTDLSFTVAQIGEAYIRPFATIGWIQNHGSGLGFGAEFTSDNFVDVARFNIRMAFYRNTSQFVPGYVGSFYVVNNPIARIIRTEDFQGNQAPETVGTPLSEIDGASDFEFELRVVFFKRFETWYYFRRHYGGQSLSEHHLRLFFQTQRLRAQIGQDRAGLKGFLTLFNDLGDQTSLVFETDYEIASNVWIVVRSRYAYERSEDAEDGTQRYLVQRRFEPFGGFRLVF